MLGIGGAGPYQSSSWASANVSTTAISTGTLGPFPEEDAGDPCAPKPLPAEVPEGWVEDLDWSCKCRFYVPGSKAVLPAPIAWTPCTALPEGIDCKVMVTNWSDLVTPIALGYVGFDHNRDGSAIIGFRRITTTSWLDLIADADGPVRTAMLRVPESAKPGCYFGTDSVNEGKFLYSAHGDDTGGKQSTDEGSIGASIDNLKPTV